MPLHVFMHVLIRDMLLSNEPRQGVQAPGHAGGGGVFFFLFV